MLAQCQSSMAVVLDDVMPIRHLPQFDVWLLLLGDDLHLVFGGCCKQWQWFVAQRLDCPERVPPLKLQRGKERIGLGYLDKRLGWDTGTSPQIVHRGKGIVHACGDDARCVRGPQSHHAPET